MTLKCIHKKKYNSVDKALPQSRRCVSTITKSFLKLSNLIINLYLAYEYFLQIKWHICVFKHVIEEHNVESTILRHTHPC